MIKSVYVQAFYSDTDMVRGYVARCPYCDEDNFMSADSDGDDSLCEHATAIEHQLREYENEFGDRHLPAAFLFSFDIPEEKRMFVFGSFVYNVRYVPDRNVYVIEKWSNNNLVCTYDSSDINVNLREIPDEVRSQFGLRRIIAEKTYSRAYYRVDERVLDVEVSRAFQNVEHQVTKPYSWR